MLDRLPSEIIQFIVYQLADDSCFDDSNERWFPHLRPELGPHDKSYKALLSWNCIVDPQDLVNLAHTCRHLKSTVYPFLYKTIACHDSSIIAHTL